MMPSISLPTPGQRPWNLNPAITALNDEMETGRLSVANLNSTFVAQQPGYDIVILAGQSNMSGRGTPYSSALDPINGRVFQYKSKAPNANTIVAASEPLDMHDTPSGLGPGLQFARWYSARRLTASRKLLVVPVAHGGTRLTVNTTPLGWRRGVSGNLYANMITQAQGALAAANAIAGTTNRIVAVLWCQGESDGDASATGADYQTDFDALVAGTRTDLSISDLPFIILTMMPQYLGTGTRRQIDAVQREAPLRVARVDVAVGQSGAGALADGNHYDGPQQRLNGVALFNAYERIMEGIAPYYEEFRPVQVTGVSASAASTTSIAVTWAAATRATTYVVEYRVTSVGGAWSALAATASLAATITGLTNGVGYDVRVTGYNLGAAGTPSAVSTATPATPATIIGAPSASSAGAYGLRKMKSNYSGSLLKVRRSSDNTTQDIGFDGSGNLDTTALLAFTGAGNGFVDTIYDQSGLGLHVSQATQAAQPQIVASGATITSGGKPAIQFDGNDDVLFNTTANGLTASGTGVTAVGVLNAAAPASQRRWWAEANSASSTNQYGLAQPDQTGSGLTSRARSVVPGLPANSGVSDAYTGAGAVFNGAIHQVSAIDTGSAVSQWLDGASDLSSAAYTRTAATQNRFAIGGVVRSGSIAGLPMLFSELAVWTVSLGTSDRQAAEANQKAYYGTP